MAAIEPECVGTQKPFHPRDQIGFRRFDDEMEMISEKAPSVDLPVRLGAGIAQRRNKSFAIFVVEENLPLPVAAAHDMIQGTGELNAQFASHGLTMPGGCRQDNTIDRPHARVGWPSWTRTMSKGSKDPCATITPTATSAEKLVGDAFQENKKTQRNIRTPFGPSRVCWQYLTRPFWFWPRSANFRRVWIPKGGCAMLPPRCPRPEETSPHWQMRARRLKPEHGLGAGIFGWMRSIWRPCWETL